MRKRQCLNSQLSHIFINFVCKNNKMIRLNLPTFEIKLSGTKEHPRIYDILRRRYIALTPEEWVRQHFVHFLTGHKGYPTALMANEISLSIGNKIHHFDTVPGSLPNCWANHLLVRFFSASTTFNLFISLSIIG